MAVDDLLDRLASLSINVAKGIPKKNAYDKEGMGNVLLHHFQRRKSPTATFLYFCSVTCRMFSTSPLLLLLPLADLYLLRRQHLGLATLNQLQNSEGEVLRQGVPSVCFPCCKEDTDSQ